MKKSLIAFIMLFFTIAVINCERQPVAPPPEAVLLVLDTIRSGYNEQDAELFYKDFSAIMFTKGFTKDAWFDVIKELKQKLGEWKAQKYLGEEKGAYTWRVQFDKGKTKCVIVLNEEFRVTGLWFR
ncbi:MAG: hypothetical protein E3J78_04130 [Candidatus Cloacimonadota bacterium]|jgi:hypothetical protein|nr:MAG: hypothetical protein E3J78_04130 [Candidatus Cloacimonadota bacterium]